MTQCPTCKIGTFTEPKSGQLWHLECTNCRTIQFTYKPLPHQIKFHEDPHKIRAFFGG